MSVDNRSQEHQKFEKATFAAGCFWGVEDAFMDIPGVLSTKVGYTGGHTKNPTYKQVCYKDTGHAEAVEITFDPSRVSYRQLVDYFFKMHDPTQLNRQGPDVGDQYRSAIFFHSPEQKLIAEEVMKEAQAKRRDGKKIVTQIVEAKEFWDAEEYHQKYFKKMGGGSCHVKIKFGT
jgi:methionine-S-sulfoxide reductase